SDVSSIPAAKATVKAINARDHGINGRPLQLHVCDTATNPNSTASCAQQAVAAHASAVITYAKNAGTYEQIIENAGIPDIGGNALLTPLNQTSKVSFPITPGGSGAVAGFAVTAYSQKCKSES